MAYKGQTKPYKLEHGITYLMPVNHCVFCKHCTDIFYDYSNGPYMFMCDLGLNPEITEDICKCPKFENNSCK